MVCWLSPAEEENSIGKDIGEHSPYAEFAPRNGSRSNDEGGGKEDNAEELKALKLESVCVPAHIDSDEDEDERWREVGFAGCNAEKEADSDGDE